METLRAIFRRAIMRGFAAFNPAVFAERLAVPRKAKMLPPAAKVKELLTDLNAVPERRSAALSVRFLIYGGAANGVQPCHAWGFGPEKERDHFPPIKYQSKPLTVPMSKEFRNVVEKLLKDHPRDDSPLLPIIVPKKALAAAWKDIGIHRLARYDLRHLFTTHLLESGVPVSTMAALRVDKDGGATSLKTYFHARSAHLHETVKAVKR